jgi:hypothetical protein
MDILPAISNIEHPPSGILLTDRELTRWQKSNPKAYANWFCERMKHMHMQGKMAFAEAAHIDIAEIPDWRVKTPLQRAIQILKRHRDIHFQGNAETKPISIIITTLAAYAYRNQASVAEAVADIVSEVQGNWGKAGFVENRGGRWWVANPVEPDENFADKWNEHPERREAFQEWLQKARADLARAGHMQTLRESADALCPVLGRHAIFKAAGGLGLTMLSSPPVAMVVQEDVPVLGDTRHCPEPPWAVVPRYRVQVRGAVHKTQYGKRLWEFSDRPVPKGVWLQFTAITNAPSFDEIQWQVVNTGREAYDAKQLRGEFNKGETANTRVRWERTAYKGTHWVEAFVIKNQVCVARSGRKFVKIR